MEDERHHLITEIDNKVAFYSNHLEKLNKLLLIVKNIDKLSKLIDAAENNPQYIGWENEINFDAFVTIAAMELLVLRKSVFLSNQLGDNTYFIKQAYLLIYETLQNYNTHSLHIYNHIKNQDQHFDEVYKSLSLKIRDFKRDFGHDSVISKVRNIVAAHRDRDLLAYYQTTSLISISTGTKAIHAFVELLDDLREFHKKVFFSGKSTQLKYEDIDQNLEIVTREMERIDEKIKSFLKQ